MNRLLTTAAVVLGAAGGGVLQQSAYSLPTMIRLGYTDCASCHKSPQGGGLLNEYGRGIDEAQSLRAAEYKPTDNSIIRGLSWGGRITQDIRTVTQETLSSATGKAVTGVLRNRWMYRNATELGKGFRVSTVVNIENEEAPRPLLKYERPDRVGNAYVSTALLSYRRGNNLEFSVGRDQLPSGLNVSDLGLFIKSRERMGYYDAPTQAKMFWWGKRHMVVPYVYAPGGNEPGGEHEGGGGLLAEVDVFGKHRTVVGMNMLRGTATNYSRTQVGPYARLGFGRWGVFAEHDITRRSLVRPTAVSFDQQASYAQVFFAAREWLVAYAGIERLSVEKPYADHLVAGRFDLVARLNSNFTVGFSSRVQQNMITGAIGPSLALQVAFKTSN
ncbi:MAG TPA: hypothetical protein VMZ52_12800 [Bryobacteraceae bacterium]|nr:hypothetical protein [Bryobacteraceae bacterium]